MSIIGSGCWQQSATRRTASAEGAAQQRPCGARRERSSRAAAPVRSSPPLPAPPPPTYPPVLGCTRPRVSPRASSARQARPFRAPRLRPAPSAFARAHTARALWHPHARAARAHAGSRSRPPSRASPGGHEPAGDGRRPWACHWASHTAKRPVLPAHTARSRAQSARPLRNTALNDVFAGGFTALILARAPPRGRHSARAGTCAGVGSGLARVVAVGHWEHFFYHAGVGVGTCCSQSCNSALT